MILLVQIICLCYTLYVLQEYATSGAYSRQHRLLPLLVGLIGVYNFYQVVLTLTGQTELFGRLKDMLLIQVLYLILIYIMDFLKIHIPYGVQWIMFCVLLALNVIVFMRYRQPEIYHIYFRIYLIGCTAAIVAMGTYAYLRRSLTMHEHQIANLLYIVLLVNAAAMCAEKFFTIPGNLLMLSATTGVCGAVHYLIQTDQLMDTGELLRERCTMTRIRQWYCWIPIFIALMRTAAAEVCLRVRCSCMRETAAGTADTCRRRRSWRSPYRREKRAGRSRRTDSIISVSVRRCTIQGGFVDIFSVPGILPARKKRRS